MRYLAAALLVVILLPVLIMGGLTKAVSGWAEIPVVQASYTGGGTFNIGQTNLLLMLRRASVHDLGFGPSDGERVDRMLEAIRPNSPLIGHGDQMVELGGKWGVDPLLIDQWHIESQMATVGLNVPENGGNMTWEAAEPYAATYRCTLGPSSMNHRWAKCPTIEAGLGLWFNYVGKRYETFANLEDYFNTYNPCSDPENIKHGFPCGTENGKIIIGLIAKYAGSPTYPESGGPKSGWYRYQGEESSLDSYYNQKLNCGPTSVAMVIQYTRGLYVPVREIRAFIGRNGSGTNSYDLSRALDRWGVPYSRALMRDVRDLQEALSRGNIIVMNLDMTGISPGGDVDGFSADPSLRTGAFYTGVGAHWVVVKGMSGDGRYFVTYDPNVWGGPGTAKYWYSDGSLKGLDRLYSVADFQRAIDMDGGGAGIEIVSQR